MKGMLGADLGGSAIKLIFQRNDGTLQTQTWSKAIRTEHELTEVITAFLKQADIAAEDIERITLTGVGSSFIHAAILGKTPKFIDEIQAIGIGAQKLSQKQDILAVSMGTGTAFVRADNHRICHIGGTGVGGGTLAGLALRLTKTTEIDAFARLALHGKLENVDLKVGDLTQKEIKTLPSDLTAANFGQLKTLGSPADQAAGVINMILETIGVMAVLALRLENTKTIVLTGMLTKLPQAQSVFERMSQLYAVDFLIPPNAPYAAALGAILASEGLDRKD
ncbi:BadF/BadG/BcrA/BcrD ATPase family protein [Holdemania massiliensis]|uniref:BadF/BadG/BcrA/BcrD ATPase family protein n=1 Tax=Holdemania massiliensis TaxID=1468449 RepID=UPI00351F85C3